MWRLRGAAGSQLQRAEAGHPDSGCLGLKVFFAVFLPLLRESLRLPFVLPFGFVFTRQAGSGLRAAPPSCSAWVCRPVQGAGSRGRSGVCVWGGEGGEGRGVAVPSTLSHFLAGVPLAHPSITAPIASANLSLGCWAQGDLGLCLQCVYHPRGSLRAGTRGLATASAREGQEPSCTPVCRCIAAGMRGWHVHNHEAFLVRSSRASSCP